MNFTYLGFNFRNIDFRVKCQGYTKIGNVISDSYIEYTNNDLPYYYSTEENTLRVDLPTEVSGLYFFEVAQFWEKLGFAEAEKLPYYYDNGLIVRLFPHKKGKKYWHNLGFANAIDTCL